LDEERRGLLELAHLFSHTDSVGEEGRKEQGTGGGRKDQGVPKSGGGIRLVFRPKI